MGFADLYLGKQKGFKPYFSEIPSERLGFVVVIPAFLERDLIATLESLLNCRKPENHVEVMVVLNIPENAGPDMIAENRHSAGLTASWMKKFSAPVFRFLLVDSLIMPMKDAGVGLARKTGMDEAVHRFNIHNNSGGIILSLDADSLCDTNYFMAIQETLENQPSTNGFNLYFEHPVSGPGYSEAIYRGITSYELHLRYLNLFTRFTGFPYAFHTIGSCFGVRADAYVREGGMNRRKAGEDFYFLHKIISLGHFMEINSTCVIPSPRESGRVPFGTGAAIGKYLASGEQEILTYPPACFHDLRDFFREANRMFHMNRGELALLVNRQSPALRTFLSEIQAVYAILVIQANSGSAAAFVKRFFRWFDAFRVIKFLNHASRTCYGRMPINQAARIYLSDTGRPAMQPMDTDMDLLRILRGIEKGKV